MTFPEWVRRIFLPRIYRSDAEGADLGIPLRAVRARMGSARKAPGTKGLPALQKPVLGSAATIGDALC
jgi:hypothetical protein